MTFRALVERLETALRQPLPGTPAQELMAPRPRRHWPAGFDLAHVRQAAGLLLVVNHDERAHIVLTVRAHTLDRHGGQVSMPGGVIERGETAEDAALREAQEEIGLDRREVRLLGALTPIDIQISGFRLQPIVAAADRPVAFRSAPDEVDRVIEVPVDDLLDAQRFIWRSLARDGVSLEFPAFPLDDAEIWGATAMVLAEFLVLLGWTGPRLP
jgi:8-oxo-dGTP pyrophosphatase MutT (NUDIX family)